ncbi:NUDIX hydrolase [Corynebacterium lujinxingii]|uniref:NUDIX hydrolase n=2 Tax=Corynebacterium lujinxingii TaxID=2763010 RepID=A0A7H0JYU9_9CORY|nr:NUDIX hydrolase [Corynebacterium lujinxingii]QNP90215.1 NUDIX hydrolase [Corynebacterium lujinxingii]
MARMSENTRPVPGPSGNKGGSGGRRRSRKRRGGKPAQNKGGQNNSQKQGDGEENKKKPNRRRNPNNRRGRGGRGGQRNRNRNHNRRHSHYDRRHDSSIETRDETSAGGLVVSGMAEAVGKDGKVDMSRIYVALIGRLDRRGRLLWSMPKGHVEDGEHQWATAEREVWEETGISGEAFDTLGTIDYWFVSDGVRIHKTVHHNLLRFVDGVFNDEDPEVTEVAWVPMSELMEHLAYADERKLARIAYDRMPDLARKEVAAGRATPR